MTVAANLKIRYFHLVERWVEFFILSRYGLLPTYFTIDEIKDRLHCANDKAMKLMRELDSDKGIGLIKSVRQGLGKPNLIYVKNFVSGSGEEEKD